LINGLSVKGLNITLAIAGVLEIIRAFVYLREIV